MSISNKTAIAGYGATEFSKNSGRSELRLATEATLAALADAGLDPSEVDGMSTFTMDNNSEQEIARAIEDVDSGNGAVILTDLFGGTPSNLAISLLQAGRTEVIAGINLPMLIRLAGARKEMDLASAAAAARDAGRNYITMASEFLGQHA